MNCIDCPDGERFNCYTHLIGAVAALAGMAVLVVTAVQQANPWKIISVSIYGFTLLLMFVFSSLYHCGQGPARQRFRQLDHHTIYLLIAGTYTPFSLVSLNGDDGWLLFGEVWVLALVGMTQEAFAQPDGRRIISVIIYLGMGWVGLGSLDPLLRVLPENGFFWLLAGGICYTAGVVFYVLGRRKEVFHGIWHLFVIAGGACHFWAIFGYVL